MCIAFIVLLLENTKSFYILLLFWLYLEILAVSSLFKCLIAIECSESRVETLQIFYLIKKSLVNVTFLFDFPEITTKKTGNTKSIRPEIYFSANSEKNKHPPHLDSVPCLFLNAWLTPKIDTHFVPQLGCLINSQHFRNRKKGHENWLFFVF